VPAMAGVRFGLGYSGRDRGRWVQRPKWCAADAQRAVAICRKSIDDATRAMLASEFSAHAPMRITAAALAVDARRA
jgi:hypothetical protein